jgi:hypothetical protein
VHVAIDARVHGMLHRRALHARVRAIAFRWANLTLPNASLCLVFGMVATASSAWEALPGPVLPGLVGYSLTFSQSLARARHLAVCCQD